jgi:hypothetical protein
MDNRLHKVEKFYSFLPDHSASNYSLEEISNSFRDKIILIAEEIESNQDMILCVRGDSKKTTLQHNTFINKELSKLFIVGQKAKSHISQHKDPKYQYTTPDKESLISDLKKINELPRGRAHEVSI